MELKGDGVEGVGNVSIGGKQRVYCTHLVGLGRVLQREGEEGVCRKQGGRGECLRQRVVNGHRNKSHQLAESFRHHSLPPWLPIGLTLPILNPPVGHTCTSLSHLQGTESVKESRIYQARNIYSGCLQSHDHAQPAVQGAQVPRIAGK